MREYYLEQIAVCRKWIAFFEKNPGWRETKGVVTGRQRIDDAERLDAGQLIAIEERRLAMLEGYARLYA